MSRPIHCAQILLEPEQHKALAEIAEQIGAPMWTTDQSPTNAAWKAGAGFVHWIGEESG